MTEYSHEYWKAVNARIYKEIHTLRAADQAKHLTFKPSDFHNLPCKPLRMKK